MPKRDFSGVSQRLRDVAGSEAATRNVAAIRNLIAAIERGDVAGALAEADAGIVLEIFAPPEFPWIRRAVGVDALRAAIQHNFDSVIHQQPEITTITTQADTVILLGRETGRLRQGDVAYEMEFVQRFQFRDGKLASVKIIAAHVT